MSGEKKGSKHKEEGPCKYEYPMHDGTLCKRDLYDGKYCIFHSENINPKKQDFKSEFQIEQAKMHNDKDYYDFTGFVFPENFEKISILNKFEKDVYFVKAKFRGKANFSRIEFSGKADFRDTRFKGNADFGSVKFHGNADFTGAKFISEAFFRCVQFHSSADFTGAKFKNANFPGAHFQRNADFSLGFFKLAYFVLAKFKGVVNFEEARFPGVANFDRVQFCGEADFSRVQFCGKCKEYKFRDAIFSGLASFTDAKFSGRANFEQVQFNANAEFGRVHFLNNSKFDRANFYGKTVFQEVEFHERTSFLYAELTKYTSFLSAKFSGAVVFNHAKFKEDANFADITIEKYNSFEMLDTYFYNVSGLFKYIEENDKVFKKFRKRSRTLKTEFLPDSFKLILGEGVTARYPVQSRQIKDDMYLLDKEERISKIGPWRRRFGIKRILFFLWWLFANYGRSFKRWAAWSFGFAIGFAFIYFFSYTDYWLNFQTVYVSEGFRFFSFIYYSIVTFTTLGFGDIVPRTGWLQFWVMLEVILGYIMLGGLISILANKLARRS